MKQIRQSNVLRLRRVQRNLGLYLYAPHDQADGVKDGIAGPRLGGAWIVPGNREIPVSTKNCVGVHLEDLAAFGVQRDSFHLCGLEVIDHVYYLVPV